MPNFDDFKLRISVDDSELETAGKATREVLEEAARATENYSDRVNRQAQERVAELKVEHAATIKLLGETRAARIADLNQQQQINAQKIKAAQAAAVAENLAAGKSLQERLAAYKAFNAQLLANEQAAAAKRREINLEVDAAVKKAGQNYTFATGQVDKTTTALGQLKSVIAPINQGLKEGKLGVDAITASFGNAASAAGPLGAMLGLLAGGVGVLKSSADGAAEYASGLETVARAGNFTEKTAAGLILANQRIGGTWQDAAALGSQFTSRLNEARTAGSGAEASIKNLGVSSDDLKSKNADQILLKIADGLLKIGDQEARVRAASEIFGDDDAIKFLRIAESLRSVSNEAEKLGLVLGPDAKQQIAAYQKQVAELGAQWEAVKIRIGSASAGILGNTFGTLNDVLALFGGKDKVEPSAQQFGQELGKNIQKGLDEKGLKLPEFKTPERGFKLPEGSFDPVPGNESLYAKKLAEAQAKLGQLTEENRRKFEEYGLAVGGSAAQVIAFAGATEKNIDALLSQTRGTYQAEQAVKAKAAADVQAAKALRELEAATTKANKAVSDSVTAEERLASVSETRLRSVQVTNAAILRAGGDELENAKYLAKVSEDINQQKLAAAEATYNRRLYANSRALDSELAKVKGNTEAEKAVREKFNSEQEKIQADFDSKLLASREASEAAQLALEQAYASKRSETRQKETADRAVKTKAALDQVDALEEGSVGKHAQFARRRGEITADAIRSDISLLQDQLKEEGVGAEERKRLTDEIAAKQRELATLEIDTSAQVRQKKLTDAQEVTAQKNLLLDQEKAGINAQIAAIQQSGQSEAAIAEQVGALKQQLIELDIKKVETAKAARAEIVAANGQEASSDGELIRLETELINLRSQQGTVAKEAADAVVAAKNREKGAIGDVADATKDAAKAAEANFTSLKAAVGGLLDQFRGFVREASQATTETIGAVVETTRNNFLGFVNGVIGPQLAGLLVFLKGLASDAQQAAYQRAQQLFEEQKKKELETQKQAEDEGLSGYKAYTDSRAGIEKTLSDKIAALQKQRSESEQRYQTDRLAIADRAAADLKKTEDDLQKQTIDRAETTAAERKRIALETTKALKDIENGAQRDLLSRQGDFIVERSNLSKSLTEAESKARGGDKSAVVDAEKLRQQLAVVDEKSRIEKKRKDDIAKAEASGRSKEEIDADIARINEKADLESRYQDQRLALLQNGDTKALAALDSNFKQQLALADKTYNDQLEYLKNKSKLEEEERARAAAKEKQEWDDRRQAILDRQAQELSDLNKRYEDEKKQRQAALQQARTDYTTAMDDLEKRTADAFSKMSAAAQAYFEKLKSGLATAPNGAAGSGGSNSPAGTTAPTTAGDGGSSRIIPPANTPPPPAPSPAPAGNNPPQTGGNQSSGSGGAPGTITAADVSKSDEIAAYKLQLEREYQTALEQISASILANNPNQAIALLQSAIAGSNRNAEALKKIKGHGEFSKLQAEAAKRYAELLEQVKAGAFKPIEKPTGKLKNSDTSTGPDKTAATDTTVTGGKAKNTQTTVGPDVKGGAGPVTVSDGSPAPKHDDKLANQLIFEAEQVRSKEQADSIKVRLQQGLTAGTLNSEDAGKIKSRLDYFGFAAGINLTAAPPKPLAAPSGAKITSRSPLPGQAEKIAQTVTAQANAGKQQSGLASFNPTIQVNDKEAIVREAANVFRQFLQKELP